MPELMHIDPVTAALLVMDYQVDALTRFMTAGAVTGCDRVRAESGSPTATRRGR